MKNKVNFTLKVIFASLVGLILVCLAFNVIKVSLTWSSAQQPYYVSGFSVLFGKKIEFPGTQITPVEFGGNIGLVLTLILVICSAVSMFFDFKKWNVVRDAVAVFTAILLFVGIIELRLDFGAAKGMKADFNYFKLVGTYYWILGLSIILLITSFVKFGIEGHNPECQNIIKYVVSGLLLLVLLSLFIKTFVLDSKDLGIKLTGLNALEGVKFNAKTFGITATQRNLAVLLGYIVAIVAFVASLADAFLTKFVRTKVFAYVSLFTTLLVALFFAFSLNGGITILSDAGETFTHKMSLTFYGKLTVTMLFIAFFIQFYMFVKEMELKEILGLIIPCLFILALSTIYTNMFIVMGKSGTIEYSVSSNKAYEVAFTLSKVQSKEVYGWYLIAAYGSALVACITSIVLINFKSFKIKNIPVFLLGTAAVIFALFVPVNTFEIIKTSTSYFVDVQITGIIAFVSLLIVCVISFYLIFKFEDNKTTKKDA